MGTDSDEGDTTTEGDGQDGRTNTSVASSRCSNMSENSTERVSPASRSDQQRMLGPPPPLPPMQQHQPVHHHPLHHMGQQQQQQLYSGPRQTGLGGQAKAHQFLVRTFSSPLKCNHCTSLMVGLTRQGVVCEICAFVCHLHCRDKVPTICPVPPDQSEYYTRRFYCSSIL